MTDRLTVAYLAIGAKSVLTPHGGVPEDFNGGELEFISEVIAHANEVDTYFNAETWNGVWVYDVVEPYGEWLASYFFEHKSWPTSELRRGYLIHYIRSYG